MKNTVKLLGIIALIAIIGFSMFSCNNDSGGPGSLTITDLDSYKDKYAFALGNNTAGTAFFAVDSIDDESGKLTGVKISGASVTLNVYTVGTDGKIRDYDGSDTAYLTILITTKAFLLESDAIDDDAPPPDWLAAVGAPSVNFKNGEGTVKFVAITD